MSSYLITGVAGFIGYHVAEALLSRGENVLGVDNMNPYYDVQLKNARVDRLRLHKGFTFMQMDLANINAVQALFRDHAFEFVIHLAAQAGVRYSHLNPHAYVDANITGFLNVLEGCRTGGVAHLVFASSSSVYGANTRLPFSVHDSVDHPVSMYAVTKKTNELMAHTYAHLYGLPCTGLRFFTVYGPWGRPDMAYFQFTKAIIEEKPIEVYNHGKHKRDFTYIDDIVEGVLRVARTLPEKNLHWSGEVPDPATSSAPFRLYNIGNHSSVELLRFIEILERTIGKKAITRMLPHQPGDVAETCANVDDLQAVVGFAPSTPLETGIQKFVDWYCEYYVETVTTEPQTPNLETRT
jgi:UDP-glucuronate 4-epimerase